MKNSNPNQTDITKKPLKKVDHLFISTALSKSCQPSKVPMKLNKDRNYEKWIKTKHSEKTKETYAYSLRQFFNYVTKSKLSVKDLTSLMKMKKKKLQELLEEYTMYLTDTKISRNTVKLYLSAILSFLKFHDVHYNEEKIKRYFPAKTKPAGSQGYNIEELQQIVEGFSTLRGKSMVLMIASSGMRRGGYADLKVGDLIPIEDSYLIRVYKDELEEYVTFCTPEARKMTERYLQERRNKGEIITPESDLFKAMVGEKEEGDRARMISGNIWTVIQKIKMNKEKTKTGKDPRYTKATVHAMRKFFNTQLNEADVNHNKIEKMMGHKNGLGGLYYDANSNRLFDHYKNAIPNLTILKENRQVFVITDLKNRTVNDEVLVTKIIREMQVKIDDVEQQMARTDRELDLYRNNITF